MYWLSDKQGRDPERKLETGRSRLFICAHVRSFRLFVRPSIDVRVVDTRPVHKRSRARLQHFYVRSLNNKSVQFTCRHQRR